MRFQPKSEEECQKELLLPAGNYGFEIAEAADKRSSGGNDMIEMKVLIYPNDADAAPRTIFDYIVATERMAFKIRHFCQETGLIDTYEQGTLMARDCVGRQGFCSVQIQEDKTGKYSPKNVIRDYGKPKAGQSGRSAVRSDDPPPPDPTMGTPPSPAPADKKDIEDDDIPF
jgi:hypothetical protein